MKINFNTRIVGTRVVLVPYREEHVEKYHEWMKSPELQHLTGSEPLTLQEEYEMQKSWREDENKCTFIVLDAEIYSKTKDEIVSMIGDTNLYFNDPDDAHTSECEIMIAEERARGRKMGWEAIVLMLRYGVEVLNVSNYSAKIKMDNEKSIRMFQKLKFVEVSRSEVFQEITLFRKVDDEWTEWLAFETSGTSREDQYCPHKLLSSQSEKSRMEETMNEERTQEDFVNDLNFKDVDPDDPLTKAALSDPVEDEWVDILGNGQLRKKTLIKGQKNTRPQRNDICIVDIVGKLDSGKEVERFIDFSIQLGDVELIQGLDLAIALMDVGESAEIDVASRFAYGDLGKEPDIPPAATLHYDVNLKAVEMEPEIEEMGFTQRKDFGNRKRERGNWWFARDEPTLAIQCYRRALDFLQPSGDDHKKNPKDIITDSELQILLEDRTKIYNNLAAAQIKTGAYDAALESVDNVLRVDPKNVKALFRKGRILHKKGEHANATAVLQNAAKLDPDSKEIIRELSILKEKSARETLHEKHLYRKMLGNPKESAPTSKKTISSSKSTGRLTWSLIGGTIAAIAGVIVYRLAF
ncbi:peptidyl-prolyl cis-trans isomerase FKBP8-like [Diachasmimorpha longicaudata]|uniref:peptidyl-prolyl cis-trans isomerase FKBP8-like n=1 Tax=Diachasmimorpha longicaudata TaxID=58733 RepID=UPI0030B8D1A1